MIFTITDKQMLLLHAANAASKTGIVSALLDQVEKGQKAETMVADACTAAVTAERDRVCDLFLTQRITLPDGIATDERQQIDQCIKSDRFKLMTSVREGRLFQEIIDEITSMFDAEGMMQ